MKIQYCPFYSGVYFTKPKASVTFDDQVLATPGLLHQLALHAGVHQHESPFPERLTAYHKALTEFDKDHPDNIFHKSIGIDSMGVAKTLIRWRDNLALGGWSSQTRLEGKRRLNDLAEIDAYYEDRGLARLLKKLKEQIELMGSKEIAIPQVYKDLVIEIPCKRNLLPDYIRPLFEALQTVGVHIVEREEVDNPKAFPQKITEIQFSQRWKAEAWLSQQSATKYDLWINGDNKRLDNWLHMSGQPVSGSQMKDSSPQAMQLFLLAVQLFQRPLNINTLLEYLQLPECPLQGNREIANSIIREGGFCNENVSTCIHKTIDAKKEDNYLQYLPFDLRSEDAYRLADESDIVDASQFKSFLAHIGSYAAKRAAAPSEENSASLQKVKEMCDMLIGQLADEKELKFTTLLQWAKSIYEKGNFSFYPAQVGCRYVINRPADMIDAAENTIWCDFYGEDNASFSTDFLSNSELQQLRKCGVLLWDRDHEKQLIEQMRARPVHLTSGELTIVTCCQQGAKLLPRHPLYLQLPQDRLTQYNGDEKYQALKSKGIKPLDNHREKDKREIRFNAENYSIPWQDKESYSSLKDLLQNPFDYVMNHLLGLSNVRGRELKLHFAFGNVAHEVIETLFLKERSGQDLTDFVSTQFEATYREALARKGALFLLPEHHLEKERLNYQLRICVDHLAKIIQKNNLSVVDCEKYYIEDLELKDGVLVEGFMDMLLRDTNGNDVIFDLKWTDKKDKYKSVLENNRALQLAIYSALRSKDPNASESVRTAYYVVPAGKLYTTDESFTGDFCEIVSSREVADLMEQLRNGYAERKREISEGRIETADNFPVSEIDYHQKPGVFPLERDRNNKIENRYSDYKIFIL